MKKQKLNFEWNNTIQELAKLRKPVVSQRSEKLCSNLDEDYNCKKMCLTRCIDGNKFWK